MEPPKYQIQNSAQIFTILRHSITHHHTLFATKSFYLASGRLSLTNKIAHFLGTARGMNLWSKGKGKAIPLQALTGPESSRRLRLLDFKTIGT
jgi:hypothetical protein